MERDPELCEWQPDLFKIIHTADSLAKGLVFRS